MLSYDLWEVDTIKQAAEMNGGPGQHWLPGAQQLPRPAVDASTTTLSPAWNSASCPAPQLAYSLGGTLVQNKAFQEAEVSFNLQTWVTVLSWDFNTTLSYKAHVLTQGENFPLLAVSALPGA